MAQSNPHPMEMESTTHLEIHNNSYSSSSNGAGAGASNPKQRPRPLFHVVALPFPGRGHINPMLSLSRRLASRGLLVTLLLTPDWLRLLDGGGGDGDDRDRDGGGGRRLLRLRPIPGAALPPERGRGAAYAAFARAVLAEMAAPAEAAVAAMDDPPADALVADALLPWAPAVARRCGVPAAAFFAQSAAVLRALFAFKALGIVGINRDGDGDGEATQLRSAVNTNVEAGEEEKEALKYNPRGSSPHLPDFTTMTFGQSMHTTFINIISWIPNAHSLLINSFHELEPHALPSLSSKLPIPIHPIAPSTPHITKMPLNYEDPQALPQPYFQWLNSHPPNSILYVSLGSFLPLSKQEVKELALGLRLGGHPFLWSMRMEGEVGDDDIGEKGMVVPWCAQQKVLCHPSVGGFLTHCGWNSTLEALYAGVPMLTYPLMWDQFPNSKMVVDEWGVGIRVKEDDEEDGHGNSGSNSGVKGEVIAKLVKKVMDLDGCESKEMRRKAKELKEMCHKALKEEEEEEEEEGSSMRSIDAFVNDVIMHCRVAKGDGQQSEQ